MDLGIPVDGGRRSGIRGADRRRWTQQLSALYAGDLKLACIVVPEAALQWQLRGCVKGTPQACAGVCFARRNSLCSHIISGFDAELGNTMRAVALK
jgi:hypothetical protein